MQKNVIFLCFILLPAIIISSGCVINQSPAATPTPQIVYVTVTPTPTPQIVYVTVTVPVTPPVTVPVIEKTQQIPYSESFNPQIQMIGNVYGLSSDTAAGIDTISFTISLIPGAQSIDLSKMKILYSSSSTIAGSLARVLTWDNTASTTTFNTKSGSNVVTSINPDDQVTITFRIDPLKVNSKIYINLQPSGGVSFPISKTSPETIQNVNVFY